MKKLFSIALVLVCFSLTAQDNATEKAKNANAPVITFSELVHDFGTLEKGGDGTFQFVFSNTGKEDLIINNARTSCGCTVAEYTKDPVQKKGSGIVKVKYDTNRIGPFEKTITVESNAENGPITLRIKGVVNQPVPDAVPVPDQTSPIVEPAR
ncbi:MAG: DUF1573 domain-containing protein [Bacteroidales bacterium]|nr:DUF1573 domain-containing protein [Bacteroidales bacterium]